MPNTTVRAAAEGMPDVNRRRLLNLTGAGLALAAAATVRKASAAPIDAASAEHPDAELLALDKEMEATHVRLVEGPGKLCKEICDRTGGGITPESEAAEDAFAVINDELWEVAGRICLVPAQTFEGVAVKLRAGERLGLEPGVYEEGVASIAADIRRLAGEA